VSSIDGDTAAVLDLRTWSFDLLAAELDLPDWMDFERLLSERPDLTLTTAVYAASFGDGPEHVGYSVRLETQDEGWTVYVPLMMTGAHVPADVAGQMLAGALGADIGPDFDPMEGLSGYQGPASVGIDLVALAFQLAAAGFPCDPWALVDCLINVLNEYSASCAATRANFEGQIDQLLANWANSQNSGLWGWIAAGATGGALTGAGAGSLGAGVGALPGAGIGALTGAVAGAVGWLFDTGMSADDISAQVDQLRAAMNAALCQNMRDAAAKAKECFRDYCPDLYDLACQEIDAAVAASGC
jgi:hypothetical protein